MKVMSLMRKIKSKIDNIPEGQFIKYEDFYKYKDNSYALSKALGRLSEKGIIKRYKKGIYYKPKKTVFGEIGPSEKAQINLIVSDKTVNGYLSGSTIYNEWGVTTQISNEIVIVTEKPKKSTKIGKITIKYSKGITPKNKKDIRKLQLLDIIKDFKKIPDRDDRIFVNIIKNELESYANSEIKELTKMASKYNPATRSLLGAILELININEFAIILRNSLNELTSYNINISEEALPNKKQWQIS